MLLFGREPKLPIDVAFGLNRNHSKDKTYSDYIADLQNKIKDVFDIVNRNANKSRDKQKAYYDLKARAARLLEGDRVLIKILANDGKHKLSDKWADDIYVVTSKPNADIPVYKVRKEDGIGPEKTLHRNHLLHLGNRLKENVVLTRRNESDKVEQVSPHRKQNIESKEALEKGKRNFVSDRPIPQPRKKRDQENTSTKVINMDNTVEDDDESDIIVVSKTAMEDACGHKVGEEVIVSEDDVEIEHTGAPDFVEQDFINLGDSGDAHESENDDLLQFDIDEVGTESHVSVDKEDDIEEAGSSLTERDDLPEAIASGSKCEERSKQTTSKTPWRSSRVKKKPKWQESGDYCMGISKQLMMSHC